jgi:hypothetical protein
MSMPERNCNPDQFFHATLHERAPGDVIDPAGPHTHDKNFRVSMSDQLYMTKHADEAQAHAGFISQRSGAPAHTYEVHPTGQVTPDLQQRQPGSFKTKAPVTVVNEV